jgi:hypothetical protein
MKQIVLVLGCCSMLFDIKGQTPVSFEVASVRPSARGGRSLAGVPPEVADDLGLRGGPGTNDPGRIDWFRVTLKGLLVRAYKLRRDQVIGPVWLDEERYDIVAKLPPATTEEVFRQMLQRFVERPVPNQILPRNSDCASLPPDSREERSQVESGEEFARVQG